MIRIIRKKVEIEWMDSKGVTAEWEDLDEIEPLEPCLVYSVGYLLEDNEDYKTITQSLTTEQVLGRLTIPAKSIKKVSYLGLKR